jgi:hypothetical protein
MTPPSTPGGTVTTTLRHSVIALSTLLLSAPLALTMAPTAAADEVRCTGTIGGVTVDNLRVPDGSSCRLVGTTVEGNITVGSGSRLVAVRVSVEGNIQAEGADRVVVRKGSRVDGSIQLVQGGSASIIRTTVNSDVQLFENSGGLIVRGNTIDGNLQCKENSRTPVGGSNTVGGNREDQCSRL